MQNSNSVSTLTLVIWAIVCIFPIVGGIVGFVLIIKELVDRRNKWLMTIGAGGILITVFTFVYMGYLKTHRGAFDESRIQFAKYQLERLVKEIEFYKTNSENSSYPDSLNQIKPSYMWFVQFNRSIGIHPKYFTTREKGTGIFCFQKALMPYHSH
jgi:hypothetical protein